MPNRLTPLDFSTPAIDLKIGTFVGRWRELLRLVIGDVASISSLPAVINRKTLAELNALGLGAADAGYLAFEYNFGHILRWDGAAWEFGPGDVGNKFLRDFIGTPQEVGWGLCDGTAYTYLVVGAVTLTTASFTTPNLSGSPAFHKSIAAYTGTIEAVIAPGISGSTANATATISGSTASDGVVATSTQNNPLVEADINRDADTFFLTPSHTHDGGAHTHGVGTLTVDNHLHGVGTLAVDSAARPPSIGFLPYFRR